MSESESDRIREGEDLEPLLTADDVAAYVQVPKKSVYELPIPRVRISKRRIRWRPADVRQYVEERTEQE